MALLKSPGIFIVCPKTKIQQAIHQCVLTECKFESGHTISHEGSEVVCMFGEGKQQKLVSE
jgi:hypothetical protein